MIWRTALLYTQLCIVLSVVSRDLTTDEKTQIVDLLNQYRSSVNPGAANIQRMLWHDKISEVAAAYAAECIWDHNPKIKGILGESIYMTLGPLTVSHPFSVWFDQNVNYNFYLNDCINGKPCGDYTQMVWANTTFVGCAAQYCPSVSKFDAENATMLVCNYYPPGSIKGQSPYQQGRPCTACPEGTHRCLNNYCDRGTDVPVVLTDAALALLRNTTAYSGGFTKPSSVPLLLAGLTVLYFFIPGTFTEC
ncbi:hypothetical protein Q7C36_018832 [Tachysurus vachellii]|uniref:SCP domain-containing protein n=1 Tax=Tachysurus vachellii TaxID=175792 RepID=A0AA88LVG4_TACVA|nr:hypothetical protein Q7C36_018832 [Tachysurus vachellii]